MSQHQRDVVMNSFRGGRCAILIATDVAARGIDVSGVDAVFNYDVPEDIEYYVHRIGRTGRAGKTGRSFTLVTGREIYKIRDIERICHTQIKERKLPSSKDVVRARSGKVLAEVIEVTAQADLNKLKSAIEKAAEENDLSVLDIAAAFMYQKVGDEPEEIKEEKPLFERKRSYGREGRSREGRRDERSGRSRDGRKDERGGRSRDSRKDERGRGGRDSRRDERGGYGRDANKRDRSSRRGERPHRLKRSAPLGKVE